MRVRGASVRQEKLMEKIVWVGGVVDHTEESFYLQKNFLAIETVTVCLLH